MKIKKLINLSFLLLLFTYGCDDNEEKDPKATAVIKKEEPSKQVKINKDYKILVDDEISAKERDSVKVFYTGFLKSVEEKDTKKVYGFFHDSYLKNKKDNIDKLINILSPFFKTNYLDNFSQYRLSDIKKDTKLTISGKLPNQLSVYNQSFKVKDGYIVFLKSYNDGVQKILALVLDKDGAGWKINKFIFKDYLINEVSVLGLHKKIVDNTQENPLTALFYLKAMEKISGAMILGYPEEESYKDEFKPLLAKVQNIKLDISNKFMVIGINTNISKEGIIVPVISIAPKSNVIIKLDKNALLKEAKTIKFNLLKSFKSFDKDFNYLQVRVFQENPITTKGKKELDFNDIFIPLKIAKKSTKKTK